MKILCKIFKCKFVGIFGRSICIRCDKDRSPVVLNLSRWAADDNPGHLKRDIAIQMGMYAVNCGIGWILFVKQTNETKYLYDPHDFFVRAESIFTWGPNHEDIKVQFIEFEIKGVPYSLRGLFDGTGEGLKTKKEGNYETTKKEFEEKVRLNGR